MLKFIVQFFILFIFWRSNQKQKGSWQTASSFLIGIYLLSSLCAIPNLYIGEYTEPFSSEYWIPVLGFVTLICMFLLPFKQFDECRILSIKLPSLQTLNIFSSALIVLSFFAILYNSVTLVTVFSYGNLGALRNQVGGDGALLEEGILNTVASVSSSMYVFAIILYFIYKILGISSIRCTLLLLSSFSEPVHVLCFVGRDGIVFWIFSFVFLFLFFSPFMGKEIIKQIKKTFIYFCIGMSIPFLLITFSRFDSSDTGTGGSIISYMGQSFVNGPLFFAIKDKPYSDGRAFSFILSFFGVEFPFQERMLYQIGDWCSWTFGTFLVSWYRNFHLGGLITVCIVLYILFTIVFGRSRKTVSMHQLFLYLLYFQVYSEGVFYFCHSGRGGNLFIIICFLMFFGFSLLEKSGSPLYIANLRNDK